MLYLKQVDALHLVGKTKLVEKGGIMYKVYDLRGDIDQGELVTIHPDTNVSVASKRMAKEGIGALIVNERRHFVGLITLRDVVWKVVAKDLDPKTTKVRKIMTHHKDVVSVRNESDIEECRVSMKEYKIHHLVVLEGRRAVGIVSSVDLLNRAAIEGIKIAQSLEILDQHRL